MILQHASVSRSNRYTVGNDNNNIKAMCEISEEEQLQQWLADVAEHRDKQAFNQIFSWFSPRVLRIASQKINDQALVKEIIQDTLSNIWRKAHLFNVEKGKAITWMYTVMRNVIFDALRKMRTQQKVCLSEDIYPEHLEQQTVDMDFQDHLQSEHIKKLVNSLPESQKEVLNAIYFQELTQEQLAKQLNIPLGTVKSRLRLALSKLKIQLGEQHD